MAWRVDFGVDCRWAERWLVDYGVDWCRARAWLVNLGVDWRRARTWLIDFGVEPRWANLILMVELGMNRENFKDSHGSRCIQP